MNIGRWVAALGAVTASTARLGSRDLRPAMTGICVCRAQPSSSSLCSPSFGAGREMRQGLAGSW